METLYNTITKFSQIKLDSSQFLMTRELHDPYVISNQSGYPMHIWKESIDSGVDTILSEIPNGFDLNWRFHDLNSIRETFQSSSNTISLQLTGLPFESLKGILIDKEGRTMHKLRPRMGKLEFSLVCDVKLKNNIKFVTFKSPFLFVNNSNHKMELTLLDNHSKPLLSSSIFVAPKEEYAIPIAHIYTSFVKIRPFGGEFKWCTENINWQSSQQNFKPRFITCKSVTDGKAPFLYYLATDTVFESSKKLKIPLLTLTFMPPIEIENLSPYDLYFWLKNKTTTFDEKGMILHGDMKQIYSMSPLDFLAIAVDIPGAKLKAGQLAILNNEDLDYRDDMIIMRTHENTEMILKIRYSEKGSRSGFRVSIYSPYIVLNKTGEEIFLFSSHSKVALSSKMISRSNDEKLKKVQVIYCALLLT